MLKRVLRPRLPERTRGLFGNCNRGVDIVFLRLAKDLVKQTSSKKTSAHIRPKGWLLPCNKVSQASNFRRIINEGLPYEYEDEEV